MQLQSAAENIGAPGGGDIDFVERKEEESGKGETVKKGENIKNKNNNNGKPKVYSWFSIIIVLVRYSPRLERYSP